MELALRRQLSSPRTQGTGRFAAVVASIINSPQSSTGSMLSNRANSELGSPIRQSSFENQSLPTGKMISILWQSKRMPIFLNRVTMILNWMFRIDRKAQRAKGLYHSAQNFIRPVKSHQRTCLRKERSALDARNPRRRRWRRRWLRFRWQNDDRVDGNGSLIPSLVVHLYRSSWCMLQIYQLLLPAHAWLLLSQQSDIVAREICISFQNDFIEHQFAFICVITQPSLISHENA